MSEQPMSLDHYGHKVRDGYAEADLHFAATINDECAITVPADLDGPYRVYFVNVRDLAEAVAAVVSDADLIVNGPLA